MSEHPKRENYDSDSDFLDAMADHYGIDRRMLRHIPIPKMTHDDDTCPYLVVLGRLEAENGILMREVVKQMDENARLKAQVETIRNLGIKLESIIDPLEAENARLKAEVERVGAENAHLHKGIYSLSLNVAQLKDEVERLTKAGDAMVSFLWVENDDDNCNGGITYIAEKAERDWKSAKNGGQS